MNKSAFEVYETANGKFAINFQCGYTKTPFGNLHGLDEELAKTILCALIQAYRIGEADKMTEIRVAIGAR